MMQYDSPPSQLPDDVRLALESFFFSLQFQDCSVSIKAGIREVRAAVSKCDLTDEVLGTVVAQYAIERGYNVTLDGNGQISSGIESRPEAGPQLKHPRATNRRKGK